MLLGLRPASRELGISHAALKKHEKRGTVSKNAEGLFDVDACRIQLAQNVRSTRQRSQWHVGAATSPTPTEPRPVIAAPVAPPPPQTEELKQVPLSFLPTSVDSGDAGLNEIQRQRDLIKLAREEMQFEAFKGTLVEAVKVKAAVTARAAEEREALLNWPAQVSPELAAELNVDERTLYVAIEKQIRLFLRERSRTVAPVSVVGADA